MTKFFVDVNGVYLGGFDSAAPPTDAIEVSAPPNHAEFETWDGTQWIEDPNKGDVLANREYAGAFERNRIGRLTVQIALNAENRLLALEGKPTVSPGKHRIDRLALLKTL